VRNGSVIDLQVHKGEVRAKVSGSSIYTTTIRVKPIADTAWKALVTRHASGVSSVVDLLQGRLPKSLLEALADRASGLFPSPREIDLSCSCGSSCSIVARGWRRSRTASRSRRRVPQAGDAFGSCGPEGRAGREGISHVTTAPAACASRASGAAETAAPARQRTARSLVF
jgi:hypothetical protein